jgi:hypothetical protein
VSFLRDFLLEPEPAPGDTRFEPPVAAAAASAASAASRAAVAQAAALEVAVLASPDRVAALGAATALLLMRRRRAAAGLVVMWAPELAPPSPASAPASRAARRLARVLDGQGLGATAAGRLATVVLPEEPVQAAAAATRAVAAAQGRPVVLALGGRAGPFDALLTVQDRVVIVPPAGADPRMTQLALAGLGGVARDARACTADPTAAARAFLTAGVAVPASLRRALGPALEGLGR